MSCVKLYENDSTLRQCEAVVVSCEKTEKGYAVILSQSVLFAEGGGQPCDFGTIDGVEVTDVSEIDGEIINTCVSPVQVGKTVLVELDWERRLDHTQQHSGEHILSYAYFDLFEATNVGFHMNEEFGTIDLEIELSEEQIEEGETYANDLVAENHPVKIYTDTLKNLEKKNPRKVSKKAGENPRVVEFAGADICTCCGTHVSGSAEIGLIKVIKHEKLRGGTRIYFLCGKRALRDYQTKNKISSKLCRDFSCDIFTLSERIDNLKTDLNNTRTVLKNKSALLLKIRADELIKANEKLIVTCEENMTPNEGKMLLKELNEQTDATVVIIFKNGERIFYLCSSVNDDCKFICDLLNGIYQGKGGGKKDFAQGSANACDDWTDRAKTVKDTVLKQF